MKRLRRRELELGRALYPEEHHERPATRADCLVMERPCPFVSCHHHLFLDVSENTGAIKVNFPDLEVDQLAETCSLDIADRGGATLEEVGALMNMTRERVRQVEVATFEFLRSLHATEELARAHGIGTGGDHTTQLSSWDATLETPGLDEVKAEDLS